MATIRPPDHLAPPPLPRTPLKPLPGMETEPIATTHLRWGDASLPPVTPRPTYRSGSVYPRPPPTPPPPRPRPCAPFSRWPLADT